MLKQSTISCLCPDASGIGALFAPDDADISCEGCGERVQVNCEASCGRCCHLCHALYPCD